MSNKKYKYNNTLNHTSVPSRFDLYKEGNVLTIDKDGFVVQKEPQGGSGGTSNYNDLSNKPSIDNVELVGNKTAEALGLTSLDTFTEEVTTINNLIKNNRKSIDTLSSQFDTINKEKVDIDLSNANVGRSNANKLVNINSNGGFEYINKSITLTPSLTTIKLGDDTTSSQLLIRDYDDNTINITSNREDNSDNAIGVNYLYVEQDEDLNSITISSGFDILEIRDFVDIKITQGNNTATISFVDGKLAINGKKILTEE